MLEQKLVEVTGIDGCGKTTFVNALADRLMKHGLLIKTRKVLLNESPITKLIYEVLRGEKKMPERAMHLLFEAGKYEQERAMIQDFMTHDYTIMDRYRLENMAYGHARGFDFAWMKSIQAFLISPDITFILDLPTELAMTRTGGDKYEKNTEMQKKVRQLYLVYASMFGIREKAYVLNANRPTEQIVDEAVDVLLSQK